MSGRLGQRNPDLDRDGQRSLSVRMFGYAAGCTSLVAGLILLSVDYNWAAGASQPNYRVFWIAMALILMPIWIMALMDRLSSRLNLLAIALLGLATYFPSYLRAPTRPVFSDALGHFVAVEDTLRTGQLLPTDPVVPMAKYFPGLHVVVATIVRLTGVPIWDVAIGTIAIAHILTATGIYSLCSCCTPSRKACSIAAIVYCLSPQYVFFEGLFAYESLAFPLLIWTLIFTISAANATAPPVRRVYLVLSIAVGITCGLTHHLTSYVLAALLLTMATLCYLKRDLRRARSFLTVGSVLAASYVAWVLVTGAPVVAYLGYFPITAFHSLSPILQKVLGGGTRALNTTTGGVSATRTLFSGSTLPTYEKLAAYGAQVLALIVFLVGLWRLRRRLDGPVLAMALFGFSYFLLLPLRLSPAGEAGAGRAAAFQWIGIALIIGIGISVAVTPSHRWWDGRLATVRTILSRRPSSVPWRGVGAVCLIFVTLVGSFGTSVNTAELFPGPFELDSSSGRDTPTDAVQLATDYLAKYGPDQRIVADASTERIFQTYAFAQGLGNFHQWKFFYSGLFSDQALAKLATTGRIDAIVIDNRIANSGFGQAVLLGYPPLGLPAITNGSLEHLSAQPWLTRIESLGPYEVFRVLQPSHLTG